MYLDEVILFIRNLSPDKSAQDLSDALSAWKNDDSTVENLKAQTEQTIGTAWIGNGDMHRAVHKIWPKFSDENIKLIGGMTMNERLFSFSLFERFDKAQTEEEKLALYKKLLAA